MFDITDFCRICTRAECTLIDISSPDIDNIKLSEKLTYCIAEAINEGDELPNLICDSCCKNLKTAYAFKKICLKTRKIICGMLNNDNNKNCTPPASPKADQLMIKQEPVSDNDENAPIELQISDVFSDVLSMKNKQTSKCSKCGNQSSELIAMNKRKLCNKCLSTCTKCSESFLNPKQFREHYETQHTSQFLSNNEVEVSYVCIVCEFRYPSERLLVAHMRAHSGERPYNCKYCTERFAWLHHLQRHLQTKHAQEVQINFPCTVCPRKFENVAKLQMHMRQHSGKKAEEAEDQTKQEDGVTTHKSALSCSVCGKIFYGRNKLMIHSRVHSGEKPYQCKKCGKRFTQSGYLVYHARIHSGVKPYACKVCKKSFTQKTTLTTHMRVHLKKNPVACPICKKKIMYMCTLRRHIKVVHGITEDEKKG